MSQPDEKSSDERTANRFGVVALLLATGFAVYYTQVLAGWMTPPPVGSVPLLLAIVTLCATVKICHWAVDKRVQQIEARHAAEVEEIRKLVAALQDLTATLLNDGDQQTRQMLAHSLGLIGGTVNGATVTRLPASRPSS